MSANCLAFCCAKLRRVTVKRCHFTVTDKKRNFAAYFSGLIAAVEFMKIAQICICHRRTLTVGPASYQLNHSTPVPLKHTFLSVYSSLSFPFFFSTDLHILVKVMEVTRSLWSSHPLFSSHFSPDGGGNSTHAGREKWHPHPNSEKFSNQDPQCFFR